MVWVALFISLLSLILHFLILPILLTYSESRGISRFGERLWRRRISKLEKEINEGRQL